MVAGDERLDEVGRPVGRMTDFITVELEDFDGTKSTAPPGNRVQHVVEVRVGGLPAQVIDDETL